MNKVEPPKLSRILRLLLSVVSLAVVGLLVYVYQTGALAKDSPFTGEELGLYYEEARPGIVAAYQRRKNPIALEYSTWEEASTTPAAPGVHSERYLMTFVNEVGRDQYIEYAPANVDMPIGTIIAKESFKVVAPRRRLILGPLLTMEKVGVDSAPGTGGWVYHGVRPSGRTMRVSQKYCHSCHGAFESQDYLGYPVKSARIGYTAVEPKELISSSKGDPARGKEIFGRCAGCHEVGVDAKNRFGPPLTDVVGRPAGAAPGYNYSESLLEAKDTGLVWSKESLSEWLAGPSDFLQTYLDKSDAGSKMPLSVDDPTDRDDLLAFLVSLFDEVEVENVIFFATPWERLETPEVSKQESPVQSCRRRTRVYHDLWI